ncbi:histidine kinase hamp region domain protein [Flammeovirgaceae bacterium 311]|nr:histidine kinase hamp region domain protein [Flammeovirgaceae bacterium 311]
MRSKLGLVIGLCTFITSCILIIYTTTSARNQAIKAAHESGTAIARDYAGQVKAEIEKGLTSARTLAQTFASIKAEQNPLPLTRDGAHAILREVLIQNSSFYGANTSWEPNAFDGKDAEHADFDAAHDGSGRFIPYWFKDGGQILVETTQGYDKDAYYMIPKKTGAEVIIDPVTYTVNGSKISLITIVAPVLHNKKFYGLAGIDIASDWMQSMVKSSNLYDGKAHITIISHNGTIAASTQSDTLIGKKLEKIFPDEKGQLAALTKGEEESIFTDAYLKVNTPVYIGNSTTPWQVSLQIPSELILAEANSQMWKMIYISALLLITSLVILFAVVQKLLRPLDTMVRITQRVSEGDLTAEKVNAGKDEIGQMSHAFETLMAGLRKTTEFANQIGQGNLQAEFTALSDKDVLGHALLSMRDNLKAVAEEDKKRSWTTEGIAKFGDILRTNNDNYETLANSVLTELVKYLKANQGSMFIISGEGSEKYLELVATYAWNRRRYRDARFEIGEGLIGQAVLEKDYVYLTDVPANYINITSGLGDANPRSILIMPLKVNDEVVGALELAFFHTLEQYQIDFVEKVCENIALTLSTVQVNETTIHLLEEARQITEEKRATEEELLQNQEELQATQEEMNRTIQELRRENMLLQQGKQNF